MAANIVRANALAFATLAALACVRAAPVNPEHVATMLRANAEDDAFTHTSIVWLSGAEATTTAFVAAGGGGDEPVSLFERHVGVSYFIGEGQRKPWAHRIRLRGLLPDTQYTYFVESGTFVSERHTFRTNGPVAAAVAAAATDADVPQQVHLSFGQSIAEMNVQWATAGQSNTSEVLWGQASGSLDGQANGESFRFVGEGNPDGVQWYHRATMTGLQPGKEYFYRVVSGGVSSAQFSFTATPAGNDWPLKVLVYGDMGRNGGAPSLKLLLQEVAAKSAQHIIHAGDFAYNLDDDGGKRGDDFMNRIQPLASAMAYQTCIGNHEIAHKMSHYQNRFFMRNVAETKNMWFSYDVSMVHFISFSTEVFFDTTFSKEDMLAWLEADLKEANLPANRRAHPWIVAFGHRPEYCSNADDDDCTTPKSVVRHAMEAMFNRYGVDIIIEAHEHSFESLYPVFNGTVTQKNFVNPRAPVHFISGAAGCNEADGWCVNPILKPHGPWSAWRSWLPGFWGISHLNFHNATHAYFDFSLADFDGHVAYHQWIVQSSHGPFAG